MNQRIDPIVVLSIGGSDPSGGAGIQGDIKTITSLGCYAAAVPTALTAQNTMGVEATMNVEADFVGRSLEMVLEDLPVACIKIGMLGSVRVVAEVAAVLEACAAGLPIVLDPVLSSTSGAALLDQEGTELLRRRLLPSCALITPNLLEASVLSGQSVRHVSDYGSACDRLLAMGAGAVLIKGGHLEGSIMTDYLRTLDGEELSLEASRVATRCTHGTGCALASAVAAYIAEGRTLRDAVLGAHAYVQEAIKTAVPVGHGTTSINHLHRSLA